MKVLVTGGAGFIGSHLVDALISDRHSVVIIDNLSTGNRGNLNPKARFYACDITDESYLSRIFRKEKPEIVYHLAAHISVRDSIKNPSWTFQQNIIGSTNIIRLARMYGAKKVIVASTGGVMYGDTKNIPTPESTPASPQSPYAISKMSIDAFLEYNTSVFGTPFVSIRCANVYGPRQNPHGEAGVIGIFLEKMLCGENPIIHGDGTHTRDYIHVNDVVNAYLAAMKNASSAGIYNIGTGIETNTNEIFHLINEQFDNRFREVHGPEALGEQVRSVLDSSKAKRELKWKSIIPLRQGIEETALWFKKEEMEKSIRYTWNQIPFFLKKEAKKTAL